MFSLEVESGGAWQEVVRGTTIGFKRLLRFPPVRGRNVRIRILASRAAPEIAEVGLYRSAREPVSFEKTE